MVRAAFFQAICLFQLGYSLPTTTLLLDWWPNPNHVPIFVAKEMGLFEKHGISVDIIKINDAPDVVSYISMKRADIGLYYMPQAFVAAEKTPIRMLAPYVDQPLQGFLMREECLEPKTVGGFPCPLFAHFVDQLKTRPKMIFLHGDLAFNLHARTVDAVFGVYKNIEVPQLNAEGIKTRFITPQELGIPSFSELVFIVHKDFEKYRPFLAVMREAIAFCTAHPDTAFALYARANRDKTKRVLDWEEKAWKETVSLLSLTLIFDAKQVDQFFHWMRDRKLLSEHRDIKTYFTVD